MIGGNCPTALEPLEVIQSMGNGPYAKRARLGWQIIGPIRRDEDDMDVGPLDVMCYVCVRACVCVRVCADYYILNLYTIGC